MPELKDIVHKIRSKNAGPFWLTVDIFCADDAVYQFLCHNLETKQIARLFQTDERLIKRFEIESLQVIKFSLPRPMIQGAIADRDMHGAAWAALVAELEVTEETAASCADDRT